MSERRLVEGRLHALRGDLRIRHPPQGIQDQPDEGVGPVWFAPLELGKFPPLLEAPRSASSLLDYANRKGSNLWMARKPVIPTHLTGPSDDPPRERRNCRYGGRRAHQTVHPPSTARTEPFT